MPKSYTPFSGAAPTDVSELNERFQDKEDYFLGILDNGANEQKWISAEAGEGLSDLDTAYLSLADNKIYRMDNDATGPKAGHIRGFVDGAVLIGADARLVISGPMSGFSGLTAWLPVYVGSTAGSRTQTRPVASFGGLQVMVAEMGFALSSTSIFVRPKPIEYHLRDEMAQNDVLTIAHHADAAAYKRLAKAYIVDSTGAGVVLDYASSNQDSNVILKGASYAGSSVSITATGSTLPLGEDSSRDNAAAQSFQLTAGGRLSQFTFALAANTGTPAGSLNWSIREDVAGVPTGTVLASGSIANGSVVASGTNTVNVSNGPVLQTSTTYWLCLIPASLQSTGVHWNVRCNTSNPYANGLCKVSQNNGTSWINTSGGTADLTCGITVSAVTSFEELAQTFTLAGTEAIASVGLWLKKTGSPTGTGTVRIETLDGSDNPTGTLAHPNATGSFAESALATSYAEIVVGFNGDFSLAAGEYGIVLSTDRAASGSNYIEWGADGSAPSFSGGEMKNYNGSVWAAESKDAVFALYDLGNPSAVKVGWWSSSFADLVNRYGDSSGADLETETSFKCLRVAGFDNITLVVMIPE